MSATFRLRILQVHRWTGLTIGLLLVFLAVTGLGLVFRDELGSIVAPGSIHGDGSCTAALPLDAQIASARAAHTTGKYETVILSGRTAEPTLVRFTDNASLYVDPCTGRVVHQQARWGGLFGRIEQLHRFRFLDDNDIANAFTGGAAALLAVVLVVGGVFLWWPRQGATVSSAATLRPHLKGRAWDLNLHKVFGVWGSIVLLAVALTSLPLAFRSVRTAINVATGSEQPAKKPQSQTAPEGAKPMKMGALWERAQGQLDHPGKAVLSFARKKNAAVEIYAIEAGAPHVEARSYVWLDAYTGGVLRVEHYATSSIGNKIYRTAAAIHAGEFGLPMQIAQFLGTLALPVLAWTGIASWLRSRRRRTEPSGSLKVRVIGVEREAQGIKSFVLAAADGGKLPPFQAGAHIDVHVSPELARPYSLCGDPQDASRWRIAVKRVHGSRGGSAAMHDAVVVGSVLSVSLPRNNFPLQADASRHVLVAAGIGITPLLAMAHELAGKQQDFALHYFARTMDETAFIREFAGESFDNKVHLHIGLPRERVAERIAAIVRRHAQGEHMYVCGPAGFMDAVQALAAARWPQECLHLERFHADEKALAGPRDAFEVELRRSGRRLQVPADRTIAQVLADNGVAVATSCSEGVCGSCMTRVVGGECDHRDSFLSPKERQCHDRILVCVSRARGQALALDV